LETFFSTQGGNVKKITLSLLLFGLIGISSVFAQTGHEPKKVKLSPLFPPALKVHQHYIDRWTAPRISIKALKFTHSLSTNWSGYAAANNLSEPKINSVSAVSGQWTIPKVYKTLSEATYSAIWVGFDGYSNDIVEQVGTSQDWYKGKQDNYAWIELYPSWPYEILSFPVHVGDKIAASVTNDDNSNHFTFTLKNKTRNKKVVISSYQPDAKNQTAEWIVEAPSSESGVLPLAKFSKITMSNCMATIKGIKGPIKAHHRKYDAITMVTEGQIIKSLPSKLSSNGTKFSVTWLHE
jgi:hypothetical protein